LPSWSSRWRLDRAGEVTTNRVNLHTDRAHSALPFLGFPPGTPRYPSREQVITYLEQYAQHCQLAPRFGERVDSVRPSANEWVTTTTAGVYHSKRVVVATGCNAVPSMPQWAVRRPSAGASYIVANTATVTRFRGQNVLVIGCGNSAGEIAIDLHETRRASDAVGAPPSQHRSA